MRRRAFLIGLGAFITLRCGGDSTNPTPPPGTPTSALPPARTPSIPSSATATSTAALPTVASTPQSTIDNRQSAIEPAGFPLEPTTVTGLVTGPLGSRVIRWGEGVPVGAYSRDDQPSDDPVRANRCGWNARTHLAYEGQPAVDWYVPVGTPVLATLDGTATLLVNTVSNPFDVYGVSREPYIGSPDRARAPIVPFSGPGGGQGAFVRIDNERFRCDFAHFELTRTLAVVPANGYLAGFSATTDYSAQFAPLRDFRIATAVARWEARRGDVIGFTGDSGYSEAPHLHYAIRPAGSDDALCPTNEPGFANGGWLFR